MLSDELTRRSLTSLKNSIIENTAVTQRFSKASEKFNKDTSNQTDKMVKMTGTVTVLTWVMVVGLIIQILLAINYHRACTDPEAKDGYKIWECWTQMDLGILGYYPFHNAYKVKGE